MNNEKNRKGVILITIDGVRRKEIYNKNIAPYINSIINKNYVKNINNMLVANKYKISYPGYNDILTGIVDKNIKTNNSINNINKTLFEKYNLKPIIVAGWGKFKNIYNTKRSKLKILNFKKNKTFKKQKKERIINNKNNKSKIKCYTAETAKNKNIISTDCEIFDMFINNWNKNNEKIKCGHLAFSDSDEWGHENIYNNYIKCISYYDKIIKYIWKNLYPETIIITTDHGRGHNNWTNHYNNIKGSEEVWSIIISKNVEKLNNINKIINIKKPLSTDNYKLLEHFIF
jgi:hypothetical protein